MDKLEVSGAVVGDTKYRVLDNGRGEPPMSHRGRLFLVDTHWGLRFAHLKEDGTWASPSEDLTMAYAQRHTFFSGIISRWYLFEIQRPQTPTPVLRTTHTYALLGVTESTYDEVYGKLKAAGYDHAFDGEAIDMHGLALVKEGNEDAG